MTTMGKQVTRAGHDTPNTSKIASKKAPRGRRCGVSLRITGVAENMCSEMRVPLETSSQFNHNSGGQCPLHA